MKNNNQKILRLLAKREYQENKRRNRILIGTVAFAVWMIFCVFSLAIGKVQADYLLMVRNGGTKASTTLENPSEEQYRKIQKLAYIRSAGMETDFAAAKLSTWPDFVNAQGTRRALAAIRAIRDALA